MNRIFQILNLLQSVANYSSNSNIVTIVPSSRPETVIGGTQISYFKLALTK